MINPYSTALATWWCHFSGYWRLPRMITGGKDAVHPGLPRLAVHRMTGSTPAACSLHSSLPSPQAPNPGERMPCLSSAEPIACDATAGSGLDPAAGERDPLSAGIVPG